MGEGSCSETSVTNYQSMLYNILEHLNSTAAAA